VSGCCSTPTEKNLDIDFLYLDLNACERCIGTGDTLDEALQDVTSVLKASGYTVNLRKTNITTKALAEQFEFRSSPTIRINGKDIAMDVKETACRDCGDLCGDSVDCRAWEHNGTLYDQPPKELIVDAIMRSVYGSRDTLTISGGTYVLPENLRAFFEGVEKKGAV
jgi:glutaredoxin